jgi:hypothetical protein
MYSGPGLLVSNAQLHLSMSKTGFRVQGWLRDGVSPTEQEIYEAVTCTVCNRMHLVIRAPAGRWTMKRASLVNERSH